ncbi:MAG: DUF4920 domain-containing protein [Ferruginibacter sp.]|nr:DUF4920 domain-containing protein [Cytophagales bacterium]
MKKIAAVLTLVVGFTCLANWSVAQNRSSAPKTAKNKPGHFGEKITDGGAISTGELVTRMAGKETMPAKVVGEVESVCQVKGCWTKVKLPDGKTMRVTFKDYGFFVPKDISGKKVVMEGVASVKTVPVEELRHYAQDAGASPAEVAKITEPERSLAFEATGVLVKQ